MTTPKFFLSSIRPLGLLILLAVTINSCSDPGSGPVEQQSPVAQVSGAVATDWFELQLEMIQKTPGFSPPVAARALGYTGVALYEALAPATFKYRSLASQLNGMPQMPGLIENEQYHWEAVANSVLHEMTKQLFANATPEMIAKADSLFEFYNDRAPQSPTDILLHSTQRGQTVADKILEWAMTDGGHEAYKSNFPASYQVPTGEGFWEPTSAQTKPLQPYWGKNRPMILPVGEPNQFTNVTAPPAFSNATTSAFYAEANEVYQSLTSQKPDERATALYWADDPSRTCTPPGHSISILCQCMEAENGDLENCAVGFAKLGIAVNDAFIACWDTKFKYNLMRPVTYIARYIDNAWSDQSQPVATPPFPEYTSGHSVQSGAMAEVLGEMMGRNFPFTDRTHEKLGYAARTYPSFDAAAQEAAISRLYGGIHFRSAIERGLEQGRKIGQAVNALRFER